MEESLKCGEGGEERAGAVSVNQKVLCLRAPSGESRGVPARRHHEYE